MRRDKKEEDRKSIAQQMLQKRTEFLRRIIAPVGGQGRGHMVVCVPITVTGTRLKTTSGSVCRSVGLEEPERSLGRARG